MAVVNSLRRLGTERRQSVHDGHGKAGFVRTPSRFLVATATLGGRAF